jgi:integrase
MTVKDRSGKWIIDTIWPDKKRTRRQAIDETQARDIDLRIRASRKDGTWRELRKKLNMEAVSGLTFQEGIDAYLEQYVSSKNRDKKSKKSRLGIIKRIIGNPLLSEIDMSTAARYVSKRSKAVSSKTINRDIAVLRHMLEWSRKNGLVEKNTLDDWDRLSEEPFEGPRPFEHIIDAVFEKMDPAARPLFTFLRHTGARREEALSLKWHQVDLKNCVVVFFKTKGNKVRSVPLPAEALAAIKAMPRTSKTDYVFYHPESLTRWSEAKGPWNKAREAAKHDWIRIHDLRHAYAIKLAEAGVPMEAICEMLGHHSIDFTKKYYAKYAPSWTGRVVLAALDGGKKVAVAGKKGKR